MRGQREAITMLKHLSAGVALVALLCLVPMGAAGELSRSELAKLMGHAEVTIVDGHMPDLDVLPFQSESDPFVKMYLNDTKEVVCETGVVQDNDFPQFNKECPVSKLVHPDTILRFEIFDSDKPSNDPDYIGLTKMKIKDYIMAGGLDKKHILPIEGRNHKFFLGVKINFKPEKKE